MLEAGRYYIGDLSVILTPEEVKHLEQFKDGYCSLPDGQTVAKFVVNNGVFRTSLGNPLSVSVGVIGVVKLAMKYQTDAKYVTNINKYGMVKLFQDKFEVKYAGKDLEVGDMVIDINNDHHFGSEEVDYSKST
jgi:hypothetical protein